MKAGEIIQLGNSLRRIDQNLLALDSDVGGIRVWYQGGEPYFDVFVELVNDQITWFQFTLRGQSLSWYEKSDRWETGKTNERQLDDLNYYPASKTLESDRYLKGDFIQVVHAILQTRAGDPIFDKLLAIFNRKLESSPPYLS